MYPPGLLLSLSLREHVVRAEFRTFEILARDQVDDARHRIRAVNGGCAARHHFSARCWRSG